MIYWPIILFAIAALGGATLAFRIFTGKSMPPSLAAAHGIFAAAGLLKIRYTFIRLIKIASFFIVILLAIQSFVWAQSSSGTSRSLKKQAQSKNLNVTQENDKQPPVPM